jgi:hypothetical protein
MAVLVRTRNLVCEIKGELVKAGVPCREGAGKIMTPTLT